jgi:hypothetical protein
MAIKSQILISDASVKLIELISTIYNVMLLAFYRAIDQSKTIFNLVNGFMDEYEDESGIDTVNSTNETYNSSDDYYSPSSSFDSYTKFLLHLDNNVTDEIGKTVTNNNVTFSTSSKFGSHAASFNGSSSYLSIPDSADFDFGSGDFTVDMWIKYASIPVPNGEMLIGQTNVTGNRSWKIVQYNDSGYGLSFLYSYDGSTQSIIHTPWVPSDTSWHHIAVIRNGADLKIYVDGTQVGTTASLGTNTIYNSSSVLQLGALENPAQIYYFNGYMDEVRVSKGIARWTSDFTPPISAYSTEINNMALLSNAQTAEAVPVSSRIVVFEEDVDAITLNTDLKAYVSRDNGTTYSQVTLVNEGYYATSKNILAGLVDISAQPSGTNMKYKIETLNNKNLKLHGTGINWA